MIELRLPLPPSVNALYANVAGRGRVKSERYRVWINAAGWALKEQRPKKVAGDYQLWMLFAEVAPGACRELGITDPFSQLEART